jgi:intein/homing endonuclease
MGKICVGDFVYTHIGGCEKVVQLHKTKSNGKVNAVQLKAKTAKRAITITENHPVWTNKGWVEAGKLKIGDFVGGLFFGNMLELHPIVSIRKYKTKVPYLYNLSVEKDESYIANGYVVHNCRCAWNGVIPEKMMKGVK